MVESVDVGRRYRAVAPVPTLCCNWRLRVGESVDVVAQTSPNRLVIESNWGGHAHRHRVKRSTFRVSVEPIDSEGERP